MDCNSAQAKQAKVMHELRSLRNKLTRGYGIFIYSIKIKRKRKFESLDSFSVEEPRAVHMFALKFLAFRDFVAAMSRN